MKHFFKDALQVLAAFLITGSMVFANELPQTETQSSSTVTETQTTEPTAPEPQPVVPEAPKEVAPAVVPKWEDNPNNCDQTKQYISKDAPFSCIDKPVAQASTSVGVGVGSCEAEIAKYDWTQSVALAVAQAESGMNTAALNDNPSTRDYSVGCFQINIYGRNAANRPGEAALKNAQINVQFAYNLYVSNGHSFKGQWGVCNRGVACY